MRGSRIRITSEDLMPFFKLANDDHEGAIDKLRAYLKDNPHSFEATMALGTLYRKAGRIADAIKLHLYQKNSFISTLEQKLLAAFEYARDLIEAGKFIIAKKELEEILKSDPKNVEVIKTLGEVSLKLGEYSRSAYFYEQAMRLEGNYDKEKLSSLLAIEGEQAIEQGKYKRAISILKRAIFNNENYMPPYYHLGLAYFKLKKYRKSLKTFSFLIEKFPDYAYLCFDFMEEALSIYRRYDEMEKILLDLKEKNSTSFRVYYYLAKFYFKKANLALAEEAILQAIQLNPRSLEVAKMLIKILDQKDPNQAAKRAKNLLLEWESPLPLICKNCGITFKELHIKCPQCNSLNTIINNPHIPF